MDLCWSVGVSLMEGRITEQESGFYLEMDLWRAEAEPSLWQL